STRLFNQQLIDLLLTKRVLARSFATINNFSVLARPPEHLRIREMIVNNHVRALDAFLGSQRDQTKIARPGTDSINFTPLSLTLAHAPSCHSDRRDSCRSAAN